jgi:hypothetical protein
MRPSKTNLNFTKKKSLKVYEAPKKQRKDLEEKRKERDTAKKNRGHLKKLATQAQPGSSSGGQWK